MKKKLLTGFLATCIAVSLTACGGNQDASTTPASTVAQEAETEAAETEVVVDETATAEESTEGDIAVENTNSSLVGTVWSGNDLSVWKFGEDGSTLSLSLIEGEETIEHTGKYALSTAEDGSTVLTISVPDAELEIKAQLTAVTADSLEFTDLESGTSTSLNPYTE